MEWERQEAAFRQRVGDYTILTENRDNVKRNVTLTELRERLEPFYFEKERTIQGFTSLPIYRILKEKEELITGCKFCDALVGEDEE